MPQEGGRADQVLVGCHLFALVKLQLVGVDSFLVNVAALLVVVDQGGRGCEGYLPAVLNAGQLADGLGDASLVEDAECFPEDEDRVLAFVELL